MLVVTSDRYPPFRPAAEAIFGYEFSRRGHRVDWLMPTEHWAESGKIIRFGKGIVFAARRREGASRMQRLRNYMGDFLNDLRVFRLLRRCNYDLIQVKDKYVSAVFCLVAARLRGVPFYYWLAYPHAEANIYGAKHRIVRYPVLYWLRGVYQHFLLYRILLPAADHVFVQSEQMRIDIEARGIPLRKMTPVPGSLVLSRVPYEPSRDRGAARKDILYVGTLIRERKLEFLIRVLARLGSRHSDARLVFVGSGENPEDEAVLHAEIAARGLESSRVVFAGRVSRDEVWAYIENVAICLSPYSPSFILNSTSPTKLIEYMAMARPVVANVHPEQSHVIQESGGGIDVPWEEAAFADAIDRLLDDERLCRDMGLRGRKWVEENRSAKVLADVVEARYREFPLSRDSQSREPSSASDSGIR
jgi:glycosyltransferase involved in cell wall biosynthesis